MIFYFKKQPGQAGGSAITFSVKNGDLVKGVCSNAQGDTTGIEQPVVNTEFEPFPVVECSCGAVQDGKTNKMFLLCLGDDDPMKKQPQ